MLSWLFLVLGLLMVFVYRDGGYSGTEPLVVLGGCFAGALFCLLRLLSKRKKGAA